MKKVYSKPVIIYDDFRLSANIAAGCADPTNTPSEGMCGVTVDGAGTVFITGVTGCEYKESDGTYSICYHIPTDETRLFNS